MCLYLEAILNAHTISAWRWLTGACTHTICLTENTYGEFSYVDEKKRKDKILEARLAGAKLVPKIAENQANVLKFRSQRCVDTNSRTSAEATRDSDYFNLPEVV